MVAIHDLQLLPEFSGMFCSGRFLYDGCSLPNYEWIHLTLATKQWTDKALISSHQKEPNPFKHIEPIEPTTILLLQLSSAKTKNLRHFHEILLQEKTFKNMAKVANYSLS